MRKTIFAFMLIVLIVLIVQMAGCASTTALHRAAKAGNVEKVRNELSNDASDINKKDEIGYTPLHYACQKEDSILVEVLLKKGADPNVPTSQRGYTNSTPLRMAYQSGDARTFDLLIKYGALFNDFSWRPSISRQDNLLMIEVLVKNNIKFVARKWSKWGNDYDFLNNDGHIEIRENNVLELFMVFYLDGQTDVAKAIIRGASQSTQFNKSIGSYLEGFDAVVFDCYPVAKVKALFSLANKYGISLNHLYSFTDRVERQKEKEKIEKAKRLAEKDADSNRVIVPYGTIRSTSNNSDSHNTDTGNADPKVAESIAMDFWREYYNTIDPIATRNSKSIISMKISGADTRISTSSYVWVYVYYEYMLTNGRGWSETMKYPITVDMRSGSKGNCYPGHQSIQ